MIPDLKELGSLVNYYSKYRHVHFHVNQKYGKLSFQGQPIYMIKNYEQYIKLNFDQSFLSYKGKSYIPIFTDYNTAMKILLKLKHQSENSIQIRNLKLIVYNLEKFIQYDINQYNKANQQFIIVPSQSSYLYAKSDAMKIVQPQWLYLDVAHFLANITIWTKRIFWSLTSRQPMIY